MNEDNKVKIVGNIVYAKDLRIKDNLTKIPNDRPGWYRWWAPQKALNKLFPEEKYWEDIFYNLSYTEINNEIYYYIYVGIAVKESIRSRLNWHVNQHHTNSSVNSGFLSTLRKSISSLVSKNQFDEEETNKLINMLVIEYNTIDYKIKSLEAKEEIEKRENCEINTHVLPLNIKGNKKEEVQEYKKQLKKLRKESKMKKGI